MPPLVVGPAWSTAASPLIDAGRFPLGVESATLGNARRLVPLINSGTAHARYYLLHAAVAAAHHVKPGDRSAMEAARQHVRRAEVVLAAATLRHADTAPAEHGAAPPYRDPHGARAVAPAVANGTIDVGKLAAKYSLQTNGFLAVYRGAEIEAGLLDRRNGSLLPGPVPLPHSGLDGVHAILAAADNSSLSLDQLDQLLPAACLCQVRRGAEADQLARLLLGDRSGDGPDLPKEVRRARRRTAATARLLLHALDGRSPDTDPNEAMAALCYGNLDDVAALDDPDLVGWAQHWRGALLRNASVTAWRWLWWWLTEQLRRQPRSRAALASALADALVEAAGGDGNAVDLLNEQLPARKDSQRLLNAEDSVLYADGGESVDPWTYVRVLVLGVHRLQDLTGPALTAFLEPGELGPPYVRDWLAASAHLSVSELGRDLAGRLLRQAEEISRRRIRWEFGQLRVPTRLREIGDVLDLAGQEGSIAPALRLERLRQMLAELGYLTEVDGALAWGAPAAERWAA
ncbi:hypothetical protein ACU610_21400 [Geodermatophilus sp. URMC 61]|uniref:hypothetical protein n=1 Tax=Geodermatophilus sp. URMC 61 TaxID=3423411 RepID=UPI00406CF1C9